MTVEATLDPRCVIENADEVFTPALVVFPKLIRENLRAAIAMAGDAIRMRPHVKTHKTIELTRMMLEEGITKVKCATFAEAEVVAEAGVLDIVFAYSLVGPNIARFLRLRERYPQCNFRPLVDHPGPLLELSRALASAGRSAEVLLDLDVGMGRTGIAIGPAAAEIYRRMLQEPGVEPAGLHIYDGQSHQEDPAERSAAVRKVWDQVRPFADALSASGLPVPRLVCGNSPTFPEWARIAASDPRVECSPGTFFLNDWNYYHHFEDIPLRPAAVLLTRVISKPRPGRLTLDLGYKAVSPDSPPAGRVKLLNVPDATFVLQNEEHLVIDTPSADRFEPGDVLYAWPAHICPTCALHRELLIAENGRVVGAWKVLARDRMIHC